MQGMSLDVKRIETAGDQFVLREELSCVNTTRLFAASRRAVEKIKVAYAGVPTEFCGVTSFQQPKRLSLGSSIENVNCSSAKG